MDRLGIDRTILSLATPFIELSSRCPTRGRGRAALQRRLRANSIAGRTARFGGLGVSADAGSGRGRGGAAPLRARSSASSAAMSPPTCAATYLHGRAVPAGLRGGDRARRAAVRASGRSRPGKDRTARIRVDGRRRLSVRQHRSTVLNMVCSAISSTAGQGLKLVCAHTGAFSLVLRARMQREVDTNPRRSTHTLTRRSATICATLYFDTVCFEPDDPALRHRHRSGGASRARAAMRRFRSACPIR